MCARISLQNLTTCKYISKANSTVVMLQMEAKLLWAVQAKLPYPLFGITRECVNELWFVKSYIVSINNEVPELYFPLSEGQIQHITMHMSNAYYNNVTKTDNVNVVNDCFENSIPSVILPNFTYTLKLRANRDTLN